MKKIIFAIAAIAALVSCSKNEIAYEQGCEISLAPVPQNITKTMMTEDSFHTTEEFNVWAWYKQLPAGTAVAAWQVHNSTDQLYIPEKPFEFRNGSNWGGATPYYWPKLGSLLFAGYYPTEIAEKVDYTFNATTNKMIFTDIEQAEVDASDFKEDIMYFNMTASSSASGPVAVVFKHALSWITVNVKKSADSPKIVIDEIKFTEVNPKGTGTVDGAAVISWATTGTADKTVVGTDVELAESATKLKEPLFIPQTMAGDLVITYTVYSSDTEKFTETYTAALSSLKADLDTWAPAKHYIYNIEIGTSEILIAPTVEDWTEVEVPVVVEK